MLAFVDPFRFGHHEVHLEALLAELVTQEKTVLCFSPAGGPGAHWAALHPELVSHVPVELDTPRSDPGLAGRVDREAQQRGVRRLVMLAGGQYLPPSTPRWSATVPTTFVLHRMKGLQAPGLTHPRAWPVVRERRARLRTMGAPPHQVVVHTPRALALTSRCGVKATMARYPLAEPVPGAPAGPPEARRVLFLGGLRPWKGAALLPRAWHLLPDPPLLHLVGNDAHDDPALVEALADLPIERDAGHQERATVERAFARAALVVAPYDDTYPSTGAACSVPLEALLRHTPVVVTDAVVDQLPPGSPGAVVVAKDDPAALARGVADALERIDELTAQAREAAAWVRQHHTIGAYLEALEPARETGRVGDP